MKLIASFLLTFTLVTSAASASVPVPRPPGVSGDSYLLMDARTGRILAEDNADERLGPASLTKIMTAYVVYSALESGSVSLDDDVLISEAAWRLGGSQMFLEVGTRALVDQLLDGMVVQSGNDASLSLAEHVAGSEDAFVDLMNTYAERLGLASSRFANPHGMPSGDQYTTARDMATLARALIDEFPQHYGRYSRREFTYNEIRQYNRNELLWSDDSVDGIKTGYTADSGYHLVSSAHRGDMRLISVVMGSSSVERRIADSRALLAWGFRFFETHRLFAAGEAIEDARIWEGATDRIELGPESDLYVTLPRGTYNDLRAELSLPERLVAPAAQGDRLGEVVVSIDDETIVTAPVVALQDVDRGSFLRRTTDAIRQWFQ